MSEKKQPNSTIGMFRLRLCSITWGYYGCNLQLHLSVLPDTQAVGPRQCLAVPQQKAAVSSKPGQQHLGHLTPNSPIIKGLDQRALRLHAASVTRARLQAYSRLQARRMLKKQENLFFFFCFSHFPPVTDVFAQDGMYLILDWNFWLIDKPF